MKCFWHKWHPVKGFFTHLKWEGTPFGRELSITGLQCKKCGSKKLKQHTGGIWIAGGVWEQAYDWLNDR